ncbi:MAG: hypothetical protein HRF50_13250 [Phycisphaerae bacterium]|jgi:hypothetical protein
MVASALTCRPPAPLSVGQFRRIAERGFGDGRNSYAYCYAWFRDHLYIGTNRDLLVLLKQRFRFEVPLAIWPVPVPEKIDPQDLCAEIWRYAPASGEWERVFKSGLVTGRENRTVPLAAGFRNMAVFQGRSDPAPAIYTIPSCGSNGQGVVLMRCADGETFEVVSEPGMGLGNDNITSFRGVIAFKGRLFATPSGSRGANPNVSHHAAILCSDDPASGRWEVANPLSFGDPTNLSIHDMAVCGGWLYAGTMNVAEGFQVWKTDAEGDPPFHWTRVLDHGAERGPFNQVVVSMCEFRGDLYVGSGIQNGGHDRIHNVGPAAGEVIRVRPDDSWELCVGDARWTRHGLRAPASGMGPGWDNPFAGYIWRMVEHDGCLYVGTFDSSTFLPFAQIDPHAAQLLDPATIQRFMQVRGGAELWRTSDGVRWTAVTRNGFGNHFNYGIRALVSSPYGLFVGTANPFGPQVAVRYPGGFRYEDNPRGGIEVWHGAPRDGVVGDAAPLSIDLTRQRIRMAGLTHAESRGAVRRIPGCAPGRVGAASPASRPRPVLDAPLVFDHATGAGADDYLWDPLLRLALSKELSDGGASVEQELAEYFGGPLRNAGLWLNSTDTPASASAALVTEVVALLSESPAPGAAALLIAGRGLAGLVPLVRRARPADRLTALALDALSREDAAHVAEHAEIRRGKPSRFTLPKARYDAIVWIEGPAVGDRRETLRRLACGLRPGGVLAAAELLVEAIEVVGGRTGAPGGDPIGAFRSDLESAGFEIGRVLDVTSDGWLRMFRHSRLYFALRLLMHQIDHELHDAALAALPGGREAVAAHVLVCARKKGA